MKKAAPAVLGALLLLLATACGGDDGLAKENATITTNVAKAITTENGVLDADQAECVAKKFVDEVGAKELKAVKAVTADGSYNDNGANVDAKTSAKYAEAFLSCVDEDEATEKIEQSMIAGSAGASIPAQNAKCYVGKLVDTVDIEHLLSSKIISDTGELSQNSAAPDADTAAKSTAALLGCVDYYALDAKERAAQTKGLSAKAYETCLRSKLPEDLLTKFLTSVQSQAADLQSVGAQVNTITADCVKKATAKK